MEELPNETEKEQTKEQIEKLLKEALEKKFVVDLAIEDRIAYQPDMIIEKINQETVYLSYIDDNGELVEGYIPLPIDKIKKVTIKGPLPKNFDQR